MLGPLLNRDEMSLGPSRFGDSLPQGVVNTPTPRLLLPQEPRGGTVTPPPVPFGETGPTKVAGLVWVHAATQDRAQTELMGCHTQCDYRWLDDTSVTCGLLRSGGARDLARWILGRTESLRPLMGLGGGPWGICPHPLPDPGEGQGKGRERSALC